MMKLFILLIIPIWTFILKSQQFTLQDSGSIEFLSYQSANYNKTFYLSTFLKANWLGSYQFCKSSLMQLGTFETQDEYDKFYQVLKSNAKNLTGRGIYDIYIGYIRDEPLQNYSFKSYQTARLNQLNITWMSGEPNNKGGLQYCTQFRRFTAAAGWGEFKNFIQS